MLHNTKNGYGWVSRTLHWVMGLAIIALVAVGLWMTGLPDGDDKWQVYGIHKAIGMIMLGFIVLRLYWRWVEKNPELPRSLPKWQVQLSKLTVFLLYLLMIIMPVSGYLMSTLGGYPIDIFGLVTLAPLAKGHPMAKIAHSIHEWIGTAAGFLIGLHILGGLYHQFVRRDNVLKRMLVNVK